MRTIYIDENYICHAEKIDGRRAIETDALDGVAGLALECYRYVPNGEVYDGVICADDFVQCIDSARANVFQAQAAYEDVLSEAERAYEEGVNSI